MAISPDVDKLNGQVWRRASLRPKSESMERHWHPRPSVDVTNRTRRTSSKMQERHGLDTKHAAPPAKSHDVRTRFNTSLQHCRLGEPELNVRLSVCLSVCLYVSYFYFATIICILVCCLQCCWVFVIRDRFVKNKKQQQQKKATCA